MPLLAKALPAKPAPKKGPNEPIPSASLVVYLSRSAGSEAKLESVLRKS